MELKRALQLHTEYNGLAGSIKCDGEYICLNDLNSYFPNKRIDVWLKTNQTKELIEAVEKSIIPPKGGIITRRGKGGGTYANNLIAMDFAMWLSVEFRIKVYVEYMNGTQNKRDWNIKRILAANNYRLMARSISEAHEKPMPFHFSNEALMLNEIVFGARDGNVREGATESQLDDIAWLEGRNGAYIDLGMSYQERKDRLTEMHAKRKTKGAIEGGGASTPLTSV